MKKKDIILIGSILLIALAGWLVVWMTGQNEGAEVRIMVDGEEYGTWSLGENNVIDIDTEYGHNRVHIQSGSVYMEEADCPDKYCKKQGSIRNSTESIICLPHRLVVEITGDVAGTDSGDRVDVITK